LAGEISYGYLDEAAVLFDDGEAWELYDGHWRPLHLADAMWKARLLTKSEFDRYAGPDRPPLPDGAFRANNTSTQSCHPQHPGIRDAPQESYGGGFVIGGFPSQKSNRNGPKKI
jgi:hypothetical protein